jgi:hypothetical protein
MRSNTDVQGFKTLLGRKTFRSLFVFGLERGKRDGAKVAEDFIFFLTFFSNHLIYESHCDFFKIAKFMLGESIDEERN